MFDVICKKTIKDDLGEHFTQGKRYTTDPDLYYLYGRSNSGVLKVISQDETGTCSWNKDEWFKEHFKRAL